MTLSKLTGRKRNAFVLRKGQVFKGKTMVIRYLTGAPKHPLINPDVPALYVGSFASLKLHKSAVKRNRMRRRCREALRRAVINIEPFGPVQMLLSPRILSLTCDFTVIEEDVEQFLNKILNYKH